MAKLPDNIFDEAPAEEHILSMAEIEKAYGGTIPDHVLLSVWTANPEMSVGEFRREVSRKAVAWKQAQATIRAIADMITDEVPCPDEIALKVAASIAGRFSLK